ncbi:MAG: 4Fe-4S binding protein [Anaerolineae bacterium]
MNEPRIGVYVCHCGTNIAGTVDVEGVAEYAASLPGVVIARDYKYMCADPGQDLIKEDIRELGLTRVVVASCSPLMHEPTFRRACQEAGLNPFFFQMANIREHVSWVTEDREEATRKAKSVVAAAVYRVPYHQALEVTRVPVTPATLVVGGGIAGIEAALQIAEAGKQVYLVEREPSIGGHMAMFDKTFPTLDCAACILTPKMVTVGQHPNIQLLTYSEVEEVSGYVGNFRVRVRKKARYVNEELCTGCGLCMEKCPWKNVPSEFDLGLGTRPVIYVPFPQAVPRVPVIDTEHCVYFLRGKCRACEKFCPTGAVDFQQQDQILELEVGAIILATGFQLFDATRIPQYGYGRLDNVLTSLEFERLCHASGPTGGKILLKDGREPESVAILHCVGSRDKNYNEYCSRVCCMYSLKLAHLVRERTEARIYEFYIDMRAFGKGYEEFYERLQREGVIFIRGKGAEVTPQDGRLVVVAEDTDLGRPVRVPVDMVVLSAGLEPRRDAAGVARLFNVSRSADGFFREAHPKLRPVDTSVDGVFLAGACQGPKDIPDSVAQGAAAAARALTLLDIGWVAIEPSIAEVDTARCSACGECLLVCPYDAIALVEGHAQVNEALCKGCGTCAAACLPKAITLKHFTDAQLVAEMRGALSLLPAMPDVYSTKET